MNESENRVIAIYAEAIEIVDAKAREEYLSKACGADQNLRKEVDALLEAEAQSGRFLPEQPSAPVPNPFEVTGSGYPLAPGAERIGDRIGRYKLLQKIGEGGCGIVYMAEQEEPVRRKVALKVIKLGMDTRSVVARFEAERQALALMDHPNIAKVLDAGATESGRPFFVMELVRGHKITQYCDEQRLSTRQRLDLFMQVCQAVQHAHQKGIIHRDLKPSNILITERDGVPVSKVIDFGIAKATCDLQLTDKTLFTAFEQFVGTPAYMSPEQARLGELDIDTRSDIYSLGVLLYELLTGQPPFDAVYLKRLAADEVLKTIRETDPPIPSNRLTTMTDEQLTSVAHYRQVEPSVLTGLLRGDLDWIVMKCLEKDRTRRYETANGVHTDIERHFQNEPVVARPPSKFYRFQKMVKRNKLGFIAASAVAASVIIGLGISVWQFIEKSKAYRLTLAAESKERTAREQAQTIGKQLAETVDQLNLQKAEELFVSDNSAAAVAHLVRLLRQNPTNEIAALRLVSALTYRNFAFPVIEPLKHDSWVISAEFSPDGQRLVTASVDKTARVWDAITGQPLTEPLKHEGPLVSVSFSPDGQRVVTACSANERDAYEGPGYARVWDAATGRSLTEHLRHEALVSSARFSPDGKRVVTASFDRTFRIWDASSGKQLLLGAAKDRLMSAQFSPDGQRVVTAAYGGSAQVWDAGTGQPIGQRMKHDSPVTFIEFSPDGQWIVTACCPEIIMANFRTWAGGRESQPFSEARMWDSYTGLPLTAPLQHNLGVYSARFSPDGLRVVTASADKTARVWDPKSGQLLSPVLRHKADVLSAEFSADSLRIVTASEDKTARVWDAKTGQPMTESLRHKEWVRSAHFSPDGQRVVTASEDFTARVWDARPRVILPETLPHQAVYSAHFSPDGKRVVTASYNHKAIIWDAQSGHSLVELLNDSELDYASFSPDGSRVVTAMLGGTARVWDAKTGQAVTGPLRHTDQVQFAQFSPDGRRVVTASGDHTARIWDAQTGLQLTEPLPHEGTVLTARFSPNGRQVLTASIDNTARLWDAETGRPIGEPLKHPSQVFSAEFSPDGLSIVTASMDNTAQVWDAKTGRKMSAPLKHEHMVGCASFSPDGQRLVTASLDKTARLWDARTGQPLTGPLLHDDAVAWAQFSPDGRRVVTTSRDKTARVWDTRTGQPISEPLQHDGWVVSAEFSPDGQRLLTVSGGPVRIWELPTVPLPVPSWVMDLAEAVSGNRLDNQGVLQLVPFADLQALKTQVQESVETDPWSRLAKWLFADPAKRTISPFSPATLEK
jgi:WD40 repeat protein